MNRVIKHKNQEGYSLVELMIVILLTAMLTLGVIGMFVSMVKGQSKNQALAGIKEEGDYISTKMERVIRDGVEAECEDKTAIPSALDTVTITKESSVETIQFNEDDNNNLLIGGIGAMSGDFQVLTFGVNCYEGTRFDDSVLIEFTLRSDRANTEIPFSVYVYLRNSR